MNYKTRDKVTMIVVMLKFLLVFAQVNYYGACIISCYFQNRLNVRNLFTFLG